MITIMGKIVDEEKLDISRVQMDHMNEERDERDDLAMIREADKRAIMIGN